MTTKVRGYVTGLAKHLVIMCALMWLFTCVSTEVCWSDYYSGLTPCYIVDTDMAFHLSLTCVSTEVLGQTTRHVKRLVTLWTLIWLFTCVSTEVRGQITRHVKRLVTLWTLIWLFTCVSTEGAWSDY